MLISDLAEREGIPKKFLELILLDLKNAGFVQSKKGKGGGYTLARPAHEIRVGHIVRVLDGPLAPIQCASISEVPCTLWQRPTCGQPAPSATAQQLIAMGLT